MARYRCQSSPVRMPTAKKSNAISVRPIFTRLSVFTVNQAAVDAGRPTRLATSSGTCSTTRSTEVL